MSLPVVHHESYGVDIGPHVFPTRKYGLVLARLLERDVIASRDVHVPEPATDEQLARVHTGAWLRKLRSGSLTERERLLLEVPYSRDLWEASRTCAGGSILAGRLALDRGAALHVGGGFHHAFPDHGEGFCAIHDVAVAVRTLCAEDGLGRALVVDLDVHHGNGTAAIFSDDEAVFTFSMHQENNYPLVKPASDLDLALPDRIGDEEYLNRLDDHLPRVVREHAPGLAFYLAGADPYREDQLGGLALTREGLRRRDERVVEALGDAGVPVAICLAGGYAQDTDHTIEIHCATAEVAAAAVA